MAPSNRRVLRQNRTRDSGEAHAHDEPHTDTEMRDAAASSPPLAIPVAPRRSRGIARTFAILRAAAGAALVVMVSTGVAWAARRYVMTSPRFAITEIIVNGGPRRSRDDLTREAGIAIGENVFSIDLDSARARLIADPWISEAALARRLPGTLMLDVSEREAAAIVALGDTYLVARDGEIIKRLEPGDPYDFPVITGITPDALTSDRDGVTQSLRRALDLAGDYERGPLAGRAALQEIHLAPGGAITLVVGKSALALVLGNPPFRRKLEEAARVLTELERQGAKADSVMLDNEARPERVVVRMR
jgi:cell division protein FtsQ